eukprot:5798030-Prymnesium_polylepis.1
MPPPDPRARGAAATMSHLRVAAASQLHPPLPATAAAVAPNVHDDHDENASVVSLRDLTNVHPAVAEQLKFMDMSIEEQVAHLGRSTDLVTARA